MKTRLLKKIRKQYSIVYYPKGLPPVKYVRVYDYPCYRVSNYTEHSIKKYKSDCIDWILERVRNKYKKYSVKNKKTSYKGIKVWYNG